MANNGASPEYRPKSVAGYKMEVAASPEETNRLRDRLQPHIRPDSVLIATIGTLWEPQSWAKIADVCEYTNRQGYACWLEEMVDTLYMPPYGAVIAMLNRAVITARKIGVDYLCMVQNDVLPEPDLVVNLINTGMPLVIPYMHDYEREQPLMGPVYQPNTGLWWLRWAVFSFMLFRVNALTGLGMTPFADTVGEGDFWDRLWLLGHRPVVDTDHELKLARYPGRYNSLTTEEYQAHLAAVEGKRRSIPDRTPVDPTDHRVVGDVYVPWMFPPKTDEEASEEADAVVT